MNAVDTRLVQKLFLKKCKGKGVAFRNINQFFPEDIVERLEPYLPTLTRLTPEPLPSLNIILEELRENIEIIVNDA
jgi:hypothetical protein